MINYDQAKKNCSNPESGWKIINTTRPISVVFQEWLNECPVPFDYLSEDKSDGQIAYVFHTNVEDDDTFIDINNTGGKY